MSTASIIESLPRHVNANPALVRRGRWTHADMLVEIGAQSWIVEIRAGRIEAVTPTSILVNAWDFAIRGTDDAWTEFWAPVPRPRHHDIIALIREGKMRLEGNIDLMMANLLYLKLVLESPRGTPS